MDSSTYDFVAAALVGAALMGAVSYRLHLWALYRAWHDGWLQGIEDFIITHGLPSPPPAAAATPRPAYSSSARDRAAPPATARARGATAPRKSDR